MPQNPTIPVTVPITAPIATPSITPIVGPAPARPPAFAKGGNAKRFEGGGDVKESKLPHDKARAYDESKDPPSYREFAQRMNKDMGPNIIDPPGDYQPPPYGPQASPPSGYSKGGVVGDTKPRYKGVIHKGR